YDRQLAEKEQAVMKFLEDKNIECKNIQKIQPSPMKHRYRNKMEYTFGDMEKDGELTLGLHMKGRFMSVVTTNECQLVCGDFNTILDAVLEFCREKGYPKYHKKAHSGLLRHLVLRRGERTGEILINIVTASGDFDGQGFVKMLKNLVLDNNSIIGILRTVNDSSSDAVKCDRMDILFGRDFYMERIMGLDFKVSAFSFFQTNVTAAEKLYEDAVAFLDQRNYRTVFDLFCGTGTISQAAAKKGGEVIGIELDTAAVSAASENAKLNGLTNCRFIAGDVFEVLSGKSPEKVRETPDIIILDPPRPGVGGKALEKIIDFGVSDIIYISCNPKTMASDLFYMQYYGYKVVYLKPYDNFPFTGHIECVSLLVRA
ncbi:MAG TPA: 23S rRNA (uracil(1939)-C(5))-methyltransferase RlmD, partial [Bacillota bacterium]|nr:23S rRNA (uracil(1939)-C(5))-methyltransferase RlmD [Bacillota bacterium]